MARKRREIPPNDLRKTVRYRNRETGRYQRSARGAFKETWLVGRGGEQLREVTEKGFTISTGRVQATPGRWQGHLGFAMETAGVHRKLKGAKHVEITVKGTDYQGKHRRIKYQIKVETEKKLEGLMVGKIQEELYRRGFRPQYSLDIIPWADRKVSKSLSRGKKQLHDVRLIVKVLK